MAEIAQKSAGIRPGIFVAMVVMLIETSSLQFHEPRPASLCLGHWSRRQEDSPVRQVRFQTELQTIGSYLVDATTWHWGLDFGVGLVTRFASMSARKFSSAT